MEKRVDEIQIFNGVLYLKNKGVERSYCCPFSASKQSCGLWCIHFGIIKKKTPIEIRGMGTFSDNDSHPFSLNLSCGCGLEIRAKDCHIVSLVQKHNDVLKESDGGK